MDQKWTFTFSAGHSSLLGDAVSHSASSCNLHFTLSHAVSFFTGSNNLTSHRVRHSHISQSHAVSFFVTSCNFTVCCIMQSICKVMQLTFLKIMQSHFSKGQAISIFVWSCNLTSGYAMQSHSLSFAFCCCCSK